MLMLRHISTFRLVRGNLLNELPLIWFFSTKLCWAVKIQSTTNYNLGVSFECRTTSFVVWYNEKLLIDLQPDIDSVKTTLTCKPRLEFKFCAHEMEI